jgi:chromate transporter
MAIGIQPNRDHYSRGIIRFDEVSGRRQSRECRYIAQAQETLALGCLSLFFALLFLLPFIRELFPDRLIAIFDSFYRSGSLVFGGGHVVLPLLEREVVPTGWVSQPDFLAGMEQLKPCPARSLLSRLIWEP